MSPSRITPWLISLLPKTLSARWSPTSTEYYIKTLPSLSDHHLKSNLLQFSPNYVLAISRFTLFILQTLKFLGALAHSVPSVYKTLTPSPSHKKFFPSLEVSIQILHLCVGLSPLLQPWLLSQLWDKKMFEFIESFKN